MKKIMFNQALYPLSRGLGIVQHFMPQIRLLHVQNPLALNKTGVKREIKSVVVNKSVKKGLKIG